MNDLRYETRPLPLNQRPYHEVVQDLFAVPDTKHGAELHAAIGIAGEAGEVLDAVKKAWAYGKPLDVANIKEELGDILFYVQAMANTLDMTVQDIMDANVAKLAKRYPEGVFTQRHAIERLDKKEE